MGTHGRIACTDQRDRIEEMQQALYHAAQLMEAFSVDRLDKREAISAAFLASMALENLADGQAEDAVMFMRTILDQIEDGMDMKGPKA
ncbi:hypothetical protein ACFMPD_10545 [Sedimentitalea sp. HM32M-2]|uniref:hypothetical protein n=1 Tax=Sedimentitalea sp. HM32M-2 TaxID=3351566 RepID=UPI00363F0C70